MYFKISLERTTYSGCFWKLSPGPLHMGLSSEQTLRGTDHQFRVTFWGKSLRQAMAKEKYKQPRKEPIYLLLFHPCQQLVVHVNTYLSSVGQSPSDSGYPSWLCLTVGNLGSISRTVVTEGDLNPVTTGRLIIHIKLCQFFSTSAFSSMHHPIDPP